MFVHMSKHSAEGNPSPVQSWFDPRAIPLSVKFRQGEKQKHDFGDCFSTNFPIKFSKMQIFAPISRRDFRSSRECVSQNRVWTAAWIWDCSLLVSFRFFFRGKVCLLLSGSWKLDYPSEMLVDYISTMAELFKVSNCWGVLASSF